ncbi:MAG: glycine zipper domain-containing protein [Gemmatimonas sp.]
MAGSLISTDNRAERTAPNATGTGTPVASQRPGLAVLAVAAALLSACGRDRPADRVSDSALDRDLTLASEARPAPPPVIVPLGDTSVTTPRTAPSPRLPEKAGTTGSSRPRNPAPVAPPARPPAQVPTPTPAPEPAPPPASTVSSASGAADSATAAKGRGTRSIGAGTQLVATTTSQLCTLANRPGDKVVANLDSRVVGPDGAELPAGTPVPVEMAAAEPPAVFAFRVRGVQVNGQLIPVDGRVVAAGETTQRRVSKGGDKGKVATGAVIGAILGRVIGGDTKGTVIGAAGGAAAGTVMAARNSTTEHCLPAGSSITVTLSAPLVYPAPAQ